MHKGNKHTEKTGTSSLQEVFASISRSVVECIDDPCFAIDPNKTVIAWNKAMEDLTGIAEGEMLGKSGQEYALPFYGKKRHLLIDRVISKRNAGSTDPAETESRILTAEESFPCIRNGTCAFRVHARAIHDALGKIICAIQSFHNISEYRRSQEAFHASEEKYRTYFENVTDFLFVHDFQGKMIETNMASKIYTGYSAEDLAPMNIKDIMPEAYRPIFDDYMKKIQKEGKGEGIISILTKEGKERVLEYRNTVVRDVEGNPLHVQGSGRDITDKIKAERALKLSEERYRNILDSIEEGYFEVDLNGDFTFFNRALSKNLKYSYEEVKGMNYRQYVDEKNAKKVYDVFHRVFMTGKTTKAFDWELKNKYGDKLYVEASVSVLKDAKGRTIGFRGIVRDITQRKEAEKERDRYELRLAQAQKLEAIGTLAGGIAHDFNNMLSAIIGYTELARKECGEGSRAGSCLDQILKAGMRAKDLIGQIFSFSRTFEAEREAVDVGLILNEALNLLRATIPTSIEIVCAADPGPLFVFADPTEIHQIVMNLCTNAYQAMEDRGGILRINLETVMLGDADIPVFHHGISPGKHVKLMVTDTGCGMDEDTMKRIFEPLFTTKKRGKGTGLGLATVHRIVTELKGGITVQSIPHEGTCFSLYLAKIEK